MTLINTIEVMMIASVWDVLIASLDLHVLSQLTMNSTTIDINECPNGGLGHALRYVPILQDHSPAVVRRGIIYLDMPAKVIIALVMHSFSTLVSYR